MCSGSCVLTQRKTQCYQFIQSQESLRSCMFLARLWGPAGSILDTGRHLLQHPAGQPVVMGRPSREAGPLLAPTCNTQREKDQQPLIQLRNRRAWHRQSAWLWTETQLCRDLCCPWCIPCPAKSCSKAVRHVDAAKSSIYIAKASK